MGELTERSQSIHRRLGRKKSYIRKAGEGIDGTIVKKCEGQQFFSCPVIIHFIVTCFYRGASSHC